jgi:phosphate transport system substrate-binding protein
MLVILAGCQPATATPAPPQMVPLVYVGPSAAPFALALGRQFQADVGVLPFDLVPSASAAGIEAAPQDEAALVIDLPPVEGGWFATPLGWEALAVIVNREVQLRTLTIDELGSIFAGEVTQWAELGGGDQAIQPVIPPPGDRLRAQFIAQTVPNGRITTNARLAASPADGIELVAGSAGAIGVVPFSALPDGVAVLRIEGALPSHRAAASGSYPLRAQIVASAPEEPTGAVREWLAWAETDASIEDLHSEPTAPPSETS